MTQRPTVVTQSVSPFRIVVAPGGTLAATVHADRVEVMSLPAMAPLFEIGLDAADEHDVAFAGPRDRLLVVSRIGAHARIHLIDPIRCEKLAEAYFPTPLQIAAASGDLVLATSATTTALIDVSRRDLQASPLPTRAAIDAAAPFGPGRFLVSAGGLLEEWDGRTRAPTRRFRLARPLVARHVGGTAEGLWLIARGQLDQVSLASLPGGELHTVDLPEPVERITAHPAGGAIAVVGARTGQLFLIDLVARAVIGLPHHAVGDVAWCGSTANVLIGSTDSPPELVAVPLPVRAAPPVVVESALAPEPEPEPDAGDERVPGQPNTSQRLAAWRERVRGGQPREATPAIVRTAPALARVHGSGTWRETLAAWARGVIAGGHAEPPAFDGGPLMEAASHLGFDGDLTSGLALAYGAHLCGLDGIAAVELSRAVGGRWDEALGGGRLGSTGALVWRRSRIRIAPVVAAAIDELAPLMGTLVGSPGVTGSITAIVVPAMVPLADVAAWAAPSVGPLLVPDAGAQHRLRVLVLEGTIRGARPLVPCGWLAAGQTAPVPSVVIVPDAATAALLHAPVGGTWNRTVPPEPNGSAGES